MKKLYVVLIMATISVSCENKSEVSDHEIEQNTEQLMTSVNSFIDGWHQDAANADMSYFDKMAPKGTYLGTDPTENWSTEEFREWSRKYFEGGEAWDFKPTMRNVYFSEDQNYVWFDELLDTWMGVCRGSGVLSKSEDSWVLEHYHLSMTIPNETTIKVIELVEHEMRVAEKEEEE